MADSPNNVIEQNRESESSQQKKVSGRKPPPGEIQEITPTEIESARVRAMARDKYISKPIHGEDPSNETYRGLRAGGFSVTMSPGLKEKMARRYAAEEIAAQGNDGSAREVRKMVQDREKQHEDARRDTGTGSDQTRQQLDALDEKKQETLNNQEAQNRSNLLASRTRNASRNSNLKKSDQAKLALSFGRKISKHKGILLAAVIFDILGLIPIFDIVVNMTFGLILFLYFGPKKGKNGSANLLGIVLPIFLGSALDWIISIIPVNIGAALIRIALSDDRVSESNPEEEG